MRRRNIAGGEARGGEVRDSVIRHGTDLEFAEISGGAYSVKT